MTLNEIKQKVKDLNLRLEDTTIPHKDWAEGFKFGLAWPTKSHSDIDAVIAMVAKKVHFHNLRSSRATIVPFRSIGMIDGLEAKKDTPNEELESVLRNISW